MNVKWRSTSENIPGDQGRSNLRERDSRKQLNKRQCEESIMMGY